MKHYFFNINSLDFYSIDNEAIVREPELNSALSFVVCSWLVLAIVLEFCCCAACFEIIVDDLENGDGMGDNRWNDLKNRFDVFVGGFAVDHDTLSDFLSIFAVVAFGIAALVVGFGSIFLIWLLR